MMATGEMATDVGTILYGKEAVSSGLIDELGGLSDALARLEEGVQPAGGGKRCGRWHPGLWLENREIGNVGGGAVWEKMTDKFRCTWYPVSSFSEWSLNT